MAANRIFSRTSITRTLAGGAGNSPSPAEAEFWQSSNKPGALEMNESKKINPLDGQARWLNNQIAVADADLGIAEALLNAMLRVDDADAENPNVAARSMIEEIRDITRAEV